MVAITKLSVGLDIPLKQHYQQNGLILQKLKRDKRGKWEKMSTKVAKAVMEELKDEEAKRQRYRRKHRNKGTSSHRAVLAAIEETYHKSSVQVDTPLGTPSSPPASSSSRKSTPTPEGRNGTEARFLDQPSRRRAPVRRKSGYSESIQSDDSRDSEESREMGRRAPRDTYDGEDSVDSLRDDVVSENGYSSRYGLRSRRRAPAWRRRAPAWRHSVQVEEPEESIEQGRRALKEHYQGDSEGDTQSDCFMGGPGSDGDDTQMEPSDLDEPADEGAPADLDLTNGEMAQYDAIERDDDSLVLEEASIPSPTQRRGRVASLSSNAVLDLEISNADNEPCEGKDALQTTSLTDATASHIDLSMAWAPDDHQTTTYTKDRSKSTDLAPTNTLGSANKTSSSAPPLLNDDQIYKFFRSLSISKAIKILDPLYLDDSTTTVPKPPRRILNHSYLLFPLHHKSPLHWTLLLLPVKFPFIARHYDSARCTIRHAEVTAKFSEWARQLDNEFIELSAGLVVRSEVCIYMIFRMDFRQRIL